MGVALRNGLREIVRKFKRARLRRRIAEADRARDARLTALGQRAWETGLTVSAADEVSRQIAGTETQETALVARRETLEGERKGHEDRKQAAIERFSQAEAEINGRKAPVDAELARRRSDLASAQSDANSAKRRLTEIDTSRRALETPPVESAKSGAPPADPAKIESQLKALAEERTTIEARLSTVAAAATAAQAEVQRLEGQSRELQTEIDRVAAERRKEVGQIDSALAQLRRGLEAAGKEGAAIQTQRAGHLKELGARVFAAGTGEPALADAMTAARQADASSRDLRAAVDALVAESKAMPRWTMLKFSAMAAVVVAVLVLVAVVRSGPPGLPAPVEYAEQSPSVPLPPNAARTDVSPEGGDVDLPGFATASFSRTTFPGTQSVTVAATATPETGSDFRVTAQIFAPGPRLPYEIRVNTGTTAPANTVTLIMTVPESFAAAKPETYAIRAFAQMLEDGGQDVLDSFEVVWSTVNSSGRVVVRLGPEAFTNERGRDGTFEAIVTLAPTRTARLKPAQKRSETPRGFSMAQSIDLSWLREIVRNLTRQQEPCDRSSCDFTPPVLPLAVNSPFSPAKDHYGTDYKADNGQAVSPVVRGRVVRIGSDERPLDKPNPRSGKKVRGWGRYVIIEHCDGSRTVYAHLVNDSTSHLQVGQTVGPADIIGQADNTGGSSGPHLHMEYWPSGRGGAKSTTDPQQCQVYPE